MGLRWDPDGDLINFFSFKFTAKANKMSKGGNKFLLLTEVYFLNIKRKNKTSIQKKTYWTPI